MPQKTYLPAVLIKSDELPDAVVKAAEGKGIDRWYYATVEVEDREGDVVRVKGLDPAGFKKNGGVVPLLVSHKTAPDANSRLPIAGGVVEWVKTQHKSTGLPALAAGIKFVDTDLGRDMKALADMDLIDVSIGFVPEGEPALRPGGGRDFQKASIAELSCCVHGMNQFAGVMRALDAESKPENAGSIEITIKPQLDEAFAVIAEKVATLDKNLTKLLSLVDDTECAIVAKTNDAGPSGDHEPAAPAKSNEPTPEEISAALSLIKSLHTRK